MKKTTHELQIELGRALLSQGIGSRFNATIEKKIEKLKKLLSKNPSCI